MSTNFLNTVPSEQVEHLKALLGCKIKDMIKYSFGSFSEFCEYYSGIGYGDRLSFFKFSYGGLLIIFDDNTEYSFGSAEDLNSLIMCCERNKSGIYSDRYCLNDNDILDKTSIVEVGYTKQYLDFINSKIVGINILTVSNLEGKAKGLPSEKGLEFIFENGRKLILSHHLTEDSFVFGVLTETDKISDHTIIKQSIV